MGAGRCSGGLPHAEQDWDPPRLADQPYQLDQLGCPPPPEILAQHPPQPDSTLAPQVELAPRGHDTPVTADNRLAYIHRVADYRLNRQIREPAAAFLR